MSTMMRPAGPLPPKVYWTRRVVLVLVLVVLTALVWWRLSGPGGASQTKPQAAQGTPSAGRSAPASPAASQSTTVPTAHRHLRRSTSRQSTPRQTTPGQAPTTKAGQTGRRNAGSTRTPLAAPTGPCDPRKIDLKIDVPDSTAGQATAATFLLTSTKAPACTLAITSNSMVVRVTSGVDVVWSSDDCPDLLRVKQVVVRTDPPTSYQFRWNGQRSSLNCQSVGAVPKPGGYWVEAALIGGEPHKAYFDLKASKG